MISAALVGFYAICYALLANYATRMVQNGIDFSIMPVHAFPIPSILLSMSEVTRTVIARIKAVDYNYMDYDYDNGKIMLGPGSLLPRLPPPPLDWVV